MFRILACKPCVKKGKCLKCGCAIIPKMNTQSDECEIGRWGPFLSKEEWEEYERDYNVSFDLTIKGKNIDTINPEDFDEVKECNTEEINITHKYTILYDPNTEESDVYYGDLTVEDIEAMNTVATSEELKQENITEEKPVEMLEFTQKTISLGKISKAKVKLEFPFEGDPDLIESVKPGCGCTADVEIDRVNKVIKAVYDPKDDTGGFSKIITVYYRDEKPTHVKINGKKKKNPNKARTVLTFTGQIK